MGRRLASLVGLLIGIGISLMVVIKPVWAADYYVDNVSGSDSNSGTTVNQPWKTLTKVNNTNLQPGDKVMFKRGGSWTGMLKINNSGVNGNPIVFSDYGTGNVPLLTNASGTDLIRVLGSYVVVENLKLDDTFRFGVWVQSTGNNNSIRNLEVTKVGAGVRIDGQHNLVTNSYIHDLHMINNTIGGDDDYGATAFNLNGSFNEIANNRMLRCRAASYDYGYDGRAFEIYAGERDVSNNLVHHNWSQENQGFLEVGGVNNYKVENNEFYYDVSVNDYRRLVTIHLSGTFAIQAKNFKFYNNTMVENKDYFKLDGSENLTSGYIGISSHTDASILTLYNNIFYLNDFWNIYNEANGPITHDYNIFYLMNPKTVVGFGLSGNERVVDPKFVDVVNKNFHLLDGSPAIDAGMNLGYDLDFDEHQVPQGMAPDIGAYEYGVMLSPTPTPVYTLEEWLVNWLGNLAGLDLVGDGKVNSLDWTARAGMATNYSLSFDGVNDYVEVPHSVDYKPVNQITIEGWVRANDLTRNNNVLSTAFNQMRIWVMGNNATGQGFSCYLNYVNTGNQRVSWYTAVEMGRWYHMACVYDGSNEILYINGVEEGRANVGSDTINQDSNPLMIGRLSTEYTDGQIDEVRIWDVARSEVEIEGNMNSEVDVNSSGLVGYWKFNEGSGVLTHDATSNHNDGQFVNGVGWAER